MTAKALLIAGCAVLALSACKRTERAETPPPASAAPPAAEAPVTPADSPAPLTFESKTPHAEVKLTLPEAIKAEPDLHAALYAEGVKDLRAFDEGAKADRTEMEGEASIPAYNREITWTLAAQTGKLMSLEQQVYEFTGGAHPNGTFGAVLFDRSTKRRIQPSALFKPGADYAALDRALCDAVRAAKTERTGDASDLNGDMWKCPTWRESVMVLAPAADAPGKIGGVTVLIPPYVVGPYAEGPYEITLPLSVFRQALAPAYADEFAGRPAKVGAAPLG